MKILKIILQYNSNKVPQKIFNMTQTERNWNIYQIEEFYCNRMEYLVDMERFNDSHAIFEEFVVDGEEPEQYIFIPYHKDIS